MPRCRIHAKTFTDAMLTATAIKLIISNVLVIMLSIVHCLNCSFLVGLKTRQIADNLKSNLEKHKVQAQTNLKNLYVTAQKVHVIVKVKSLQSHLHAGGGKQQQAKH